MKKMYTVFAAALALAACGRNDGAPSPAVVEVVTKYCAQDFKPYDAVVDACIAEGGKGKRGAACATYDQVDAILGQRQLASGFKECNREIRWGSNANKK